MRPVGAELFHADGRTDSSDAANTRLLQFFFRKRVKLQSPERKKIELQVHIFQFLS